MRDEIQADHSALLKQSLIAIDRLQAKLADVQASKHQPIAIVGMACRFPGDADSPAKFWQLLRDGRDAVTEVPPDRWDADEFFDPDPGVPGKAYTRWGAFLNDVGMFDAGFFGISPREAHSVDPQHRLLLEATWEAIENAGIAAASLAGSATGVFIGMTTHDYSLQAARAGVSRYGDAFTASGSVHSIASGRISYLLGLHGPNLAVDTACSSSLVAIHLAVQSLRQGESNLALAGGVNLTLIPEGSILTSRARMMSADGHCKTFDASADGYVRGEGCGMIVLKRLADAQRDGDLILAVLRGSAINQDGRSSGMSAPNGNAQVQVIRAALSDAGMTPDDIDYIEAHGTGTPLGDPIELHALGKVFGNRERVGRLRVGSVKTNIGHLEAAAGMAGLLKTILALQHRQLPPHLHLREPSRHIAWEGLAIDVPTRLTDWTADDGRIRRAGISSFGFSGTNAHLVLEEADVTAQPLPASAGEPGLLVMSAQTEDALKALAARYRELLLQAQGPGLAEIAAQAIVGRSHLPIRLAVIAATREEAAARLASEATDDPGLIRGRAIRGSEPEVAFLFTGQGAQYPGMGQGLYRSQPAFRNALDDCDRLLQPMLGIALPELLWPPAGSASLLDDTRLTQPALFAIEYALARLWESHGIRPTTVLGHSVGEYVAACIAGVFSLEDGLRLVCERARLMGSLPAGGAMAAIFASEAAVLAMIQVQGSALCIAGVNGPDNTVVSGEEAEVERLLRHAAAAGMDGQRLKVSHAFHSHLMDPILDAFEACAATVSYRAPAIGLISNLTGELAGPELLTPQYWRRHLREAVRFGDSVSTLAKDGCRIGVEVGPHPVLIGMARRASPDPEGVWIGSLRRGRDDMTSFLEGLGQLYVVGHKVDAEAIWGAAACRRRVMLPTYPFQRSHYWQRLEGQMTATLGATKRGHPLLGGIVPSPIRIFQAEIGVARQPWIRDHRIAGLVILPAAAFIEAMLAAAVEVSGSDRCTLEAFRISEALILPPADPVLLQTLVREKVDGIREVQIFSRAAPSGDAGSAGNWQLHASAQFGSVADGPVPPALSLDELRKHLVGRRDVAGYYSFLSGHGADYGPAFRGLTEIRYQDRQVLGHIRLPDALAADTNRMLVHPALLDACLQLIGVAVEGVPAAGEGRRLYLPVGFERYVVHRRAGSRAWAHVTVAPVAEDATDLVAEVILIDEEGNQIAELRGMALRRVLEAKQGRTAPGRPETGLAFQVAWRPAGDAAGSEFDSVDRWLVLGDAPFLGESLCRRLREGGVDAQQVVHGDALTMSGPVWTIDSRDLTHYQRLFDSLADSSRSRGPIGIVSLWALEPLTDRDRPVTSLDALDALDAVEAGTLRILEATLALGKALQDVTARLWVVTRGAQATERAEPDLMQTPLWGMAGVIAAEMPALRTVRIDLAPAPDAGEADLLLATILRADAEDRIALRRGEAIVARLVAAPLDASPASQPLRLEISGRGTLSNLRLLPFEKIAPGQGEVEIDIHGAGLNFRDVLNVLGMYPGDAGPLGNECAGVVVAVGEGVRHLRAGDEVIAMASRSLATSVIAPAALTVPKPAFLSFSEAATIPVAFLTAAYGLRNLAELRKGDRVLIHAVTGGVGMAAAQLALSAGAEVFGTAGTPEKRALARRLGVHHVGDSRSLAFFDELMPLTGGEGVDIVVNSLSGEFIPTSLRMLRKGAGRFIEIGKTDIWDAARVAAEFPGVDYWALYLGEVTAAQPELMRALLVGLLDEFGSGVLKPLPQQIYPLDRAEEAFRYMGQGQHVGKIVLIPRRDPTPRADRSYLITGGLGGIGLTCAAWLVAAGARHLALAGRREPSAAARHAIAELERQGASVTVLQADIGDPRQASTMCQEIARTMPPLAGVLHAAGVIDDAMIPGQTLDRFKTVMAPKVRGAWNLHVLTARLPLDFFVLFSSGAALLGSPGQSNYAAANSFLDALAALRHARGLPALSINWGSWSEVGMAAGVGEDHQRRWSAMGIGMIKPAAGVAILSKLLKQGVAPQYAALELDRDRLPAGMAPFYSELLGSGEALRPQPGLDIVARLTKAKPSERLDLLQAYLSDQVSTVLALGPGQKVDAYRSLLELGMDSLMAMELRNRIQAAMGIQIGVALLLGGASLIELSSRLLEDAEALPHGASPQRPRLEPVSGKALATSLPGAGNDGDEGTL
jgi:acyl transferase domain-containing protein